MNAKTIAAYAAVLAAIAGIFVALETWLAQEDIGTPALLHWIKAIAAGVVPIGTAFGVLYAALVQLRVTYVNAGLNLAASGNMVDVHGKPITVISGETTPPKPATSESAPQIVKDYGGQTGGG